ncbi:MAG: aminomethyl-transferring glycine dehydrogenase subunit GcvPA [Candidatus Omnitrophica bacterium]|nr:aminomethyl-transferring glycine dehydrogenase subunit GcvPA [Candidatus Omnitrophota bacterium]
MDYIPNTDEQFTAMLQTIGAGSFEDLLADIPPELRCRSFDLPAGLSEYEVLGLFESLAGPNRSLREVTSFLGFGAYQHLIPTVVDALASRGEWLTPYTPYQAEASQGTLQMIYEFQTLICELMQMEVANASMYDGASSFAEAAVLALRTRPATGGAGGRNRLLISEAVHPHYRQAASTYLSGFPCAIQQIPQTNGVTDLEALAAALKEDVAAVLMQQPNVFGCLEPMEQAGELAHRAGALFVANAYPISLGVLKPPGAYGADVAVGEGRCLGSPLAYGGPGLGVFAATQALLRRMPGRLAGCTVDQAGRRGFTLTLQTREQHIRREKATSNICTNAGLLCLRATLFLSLLGPQGLKELAGMSLQNAHALFERLRQLPFVQPVFDQPFFNEFVVRYTDGRTAEAVNTRLLKAGFFGGLPLAPWYPELGEAALWCVTETIGQEQMNRVMETLERV